MTVEDLIELYRYNDYSNPDNLEYDEDGETDAILKIKVDGTYYYPHEKSLIKHRYKDCGIDEVLDREVDCFSHQINLESDGLHHALYILTKR